MDEKERQKWLKDITEKAFYSDESQRAAALQQIACALEEHKKGWCDSDATIRMVERYLDVYLCIKIPE